MRRATVPQGRAMLREPGHRSPGGAGYLRGPCCLAAVSAVAWLLPATPALGLRDHRAQGKERAS